MIGLVGSFDRENYGDLVYPHLLSELLLLHGEQERLQAFSAVAGQAPMGSRFPVETISKLYSADAMPLSKLIVGGGDLLRLDHDRLAAHYETPEPRRPHARGPLLHRLQQWHQRRQGRRGARLLIEKVWQEIGRADPALFMLDARRMPTVKSLAYCSCGVPFEIPENARARVAAVMNQAAFIYVRDEPSMQKLSAAGVTRSIRVAPDIVVVLSDVIPRSSLEAAGRRLLAESGLDAAKRVILFQVNASAADLGPMLGRELSAFARRTNTQVGLLPIGNCHGDEEILSQVGEAANSAAVRTLHPRTIGDVMALIAISDGIAGTSLHGSVTALSYGIPHLALPLAADKIDGYFQAAGLPLDFRLNDWSALATGLDRLAGADRAPFEQLAGSAKREANAAFRDMLSAMLDGATGSRSTADA
jgi:hypothetical protein